MIELLVVIAIIGVLIGLLLSAVQKVRESANRATCQNHMKNVGLALHHHHDARGRLPVGCYPLNGRSSWPASGWQMHILPFVEQAAAYEDALADYKADSYFARPRRPHRILSRVMKIYICPSDSRIQQSVLSEEYQVQVAFTSYLGSCGTSCNREDGVLYPDSETRFPDIRDGLSQTLMVGERPPSFDLRFGWWYAGLGQDQFGSAEMILGTREKNMGTLTACEQKAYEFTPSRFSDPCGMFHFWSPHSGGANFALADGSVRFITYAANPIMPALASRAGGEVVEVP